MTSLRPATGADATALAELEEAANVVALRHIFGNRPFPRADVLEHWRRTLADPAVVVEVVDGADDGGAVGGEDGGAGGVLDCFVAHDATTLRHLAVRPQRWGAGLARAAVERAVSSIRAAGHEPRLWCLAENHRASGLYAHLGWTASGAEQPAPWPPHPVEREWRLRGSTP